MSSAAEQSRASGDVGADVMETAAVQVLSGQADIQQWQEDLYRDVHRHPELGHHEVRTASIAAEALRSFGYEVHQKIGTTGVVGVLRNGVGPTVLMRADMDALPMAERTGLDYASTDHVIDDSGDDTPVMHSCGHDVHVACLLAAARLLAGELTAWRGTFVALFQPAEEIATGAETMVGGGLVQFVPKPDVALAQHVLAFPSGRVGVRPGPFLSGADSMRVTVYGRGSHGSMPQLSVDPVVLAAMIVVRLQAVVSREVAPDDFAVVTVGRIVAGSKSNIISDHAVLELNLRTYSDATRSTLLAAIERVVRGECAASGSPQDPDFELYDHFPLTDNEPVATGRIDGAFRTHFGDDAFTIDRQSASEDFSEIPKAFGVPYVYWGIGGVDPQEYAAAETAGTVSTAIPANHSPRFAPVIEPTLRVGTAAVVVAALAWLASPVRAPGSARAKPLPNNRS